MATQSICSIPGCGKVHYAREWCGMHYMRWYTHGDPMGVAPKRDTKCQKYYREVVLRHEGDDCLIWPFSRDSRGYGHLRRDGKVKSTSRLVCEDINGPCPSPIHEAAHTCGKGHLGCVSPAHLIWKTRADNQADRITHGTDIRGERNVRSKLTVQNVRDIRSELSLTRTEMAAKYGVSLRCIYSILEGASWRSA